MTLCIAANCWDSDKVLHRIVFGSDRRAEVDYAGGDVAFKFAWAAKGWAALVSGGLSEAQDFLGTCRTVLTDTTITRDNVSDKFNEVSSAHKEKLCRRYVAQQYGVSFDRFLTQGESEFPRDVRVRVFHELADLDSGCDVLVFGFTKRIAPKGQFVADPQIVEITKYGKVVLHQNFAAVGSGDVIAESALYQREQSIFLPIETTLYHLYEASKLAAGTAPGVGEISQWLVFDPPLDMEGEGGLSLFTEKSLTIMQKMFQAVGPKPLPSIERLDESWLAPIDDDEPEELPSPPSDEQTSEGQP